MSEFFSEISQLFNICYEYLGLVKRKIMTFFVTYGGVVNWGSEKEFSLHLFKRLNFVQGLTVIKNAEILARKLTFEQHQNLTDEYRTRLILKFAESLENIVIATLQVDNKILDVFCNVIRELPVTFPRIKSKSEKNTFII